MISRLVFITILLVSLVIFQYRYHIYQINVRQFFYLTTGVYGTSIVLWSFLSRTRRSSLIAYLHIGADACFISWLVTLTGAIDSGFTILYHITIISASIILSRRGGYLSASLSSIFYGTMLDLQYYNLLGFVQSQNYTAGQVLYLLFVTILSFYVVAFLSGSLSERLRSARQELREKSIDFDDLRVLQENILRSVGSGIVTLNMEGAVTSWNHAAETITGYGLADIRREWKRVFGESIKGLFGQTNDLRERPIRFEGRVEKKDGTPAVLGFTASLLRDDNDVVRGIIVTFQDITRMAEMEEQMRRHERLATIGSLAAGIAHEIRNPLASLSGSIQMLREDMHLLEEKKQLMDIVIRETDRLNTIITEFLDYARPRSVQGLAVDLSNILRDTVLLFENSREARQGITVVCEIPASLNFHGDEQRIRQVFWNLVINAAQAITGDGLITVKARGLLSETGEEVLISVSDTGTGIPLEMMDKIFDPFFTTKAYGTGLGLAIVYRIVEDHGGSIEAKNMDGGGASFTVHLPVRDAWRSKVQTV